MSTSEQIKVLVVHDEPLVRAGLIAALGTCPDIQPISFEPDGFEALRSEPPFVNVLVADYPNGVELARFFTRQCAARIRPKVMIVTGSDSEWNIRNALERGIVGYLLAGCPLEYLAVAVRTVHRGARYFSPGVAQRLAESLSAEPLTCREEAVLRLVVDGLGNKAIASRLGVALGTVKTHLRTIFDKLKVETRTQAASIAARRGLLSGRNRHPIEHSDVSNSCAMPKKYADRQDGYGNYRPVLDETHSSSRVETSAPR